MRKSFWALPQTSVMDLFEADLFVSGSSGAATG
jgi:hypothetical protein